MTGIELIAALQDLPLDERILPVRLFTDHGQCAMAANEVSIGGTREEEYQAELAYQEDYPDDTIHKFILIDA
jgi:hypothetical protein